MCWLRVLCCVARPAAVCCANRRAVDIALLLLVRRCPSSPITPPDPHRPWFDFRPGGGIVWAVFCMRDVQISCEGACGCSPDPVRACGHAPASLLFPYVNLGPVVLGMRFCWAALLAFSYFFCTGAGRRFAASCRESRVRPMRAFGLLSIIPVICVASASMAANFNHLQG